MITDAAMLADAVASRGIRSALVLLSKFTRFAGPSMIAVDIADTLAPLGVRMTVAALGVSPPFARRFPSICEVVDLRRDPGPLLQREFDLVITQGWSPACFGLLECGVRHRYLVVGSFSGLTAGEAIFGLEAEADVLLFHSARNRDLQSPSLRAGAAPRLVYGNAVPARWFDAPPSPPTALRRVGVVSNHVPAEVRAAARQLQDAGIYVAFVGAQDGPRPVTPDLVDGFDCIVAIGHTAQKAMARRRSFFCYDHFGGPGYITARTVAEEQYICFSGRSAGQRRTGGEIARQLVEGFGDAAAAAPHLYDMAARSHRIETVLCDVLTAAAPTAFRTCRTPENRNLRKVFQHGFERAETSPFVRNVGFDYEREPTLLHSRFVRLRNDVLEGLAVSRLPPFIFGSTEPSPIGFRLRLTFRPGIACPAVLVQREGDDDPAVVMTAIDAVAKGEGDPLRPIVGTAAVTVLVGVEPIRYTLAVSVAGETVAVATVSFDTKRSAGKRTAGM